MKMFNRHYVVLFLLVAGLFFYLNIDIYLYRSLSSTARNASQTTTNLHELRTLLYVDRYMLRETANERSPKSKLSLDSANRIENITKSFRGSESIMDRFSKTEAYLLHFKEAISPDQKRATSDFAGDSIDSNLPLILEAAIVEVENKIQEQNIFVRRKIAFFLNIFVLKSIITTILVIVLFSQLIRLNSKSREVSRQRRHQTTLYQKNAQLIDVNRALNKFAAIAAHDLRAPTRQITMFSSMIREDIKDIELIYTHLARIDKCAERMRVLVDSLLDFSITGFRPPNVSIVDTKKLLESVIQSSDRKIAESEYKITYSDLLPVLADAVLVERIFENLIDNSVKFRRRDIQLEIKIHSEKEGRMANFVFEDNGVGVSDDISERIFEPLFRGNTDKNTAAGVGLGLSLVKSIVEGHGGDISVAESEASGLRVRFSLPLAIDSI